MSSNFTKQTIPIFLFQSLVHIPNWLISVPESKLSYAAKIVYGFMAAKSDSVGTCRINELIFKEEIGITYKNLMKALNELIKENLIKQSSEYEYMFFDHKWMSGKYD